jgi:hypothetical protein
VATQTYKNLAQVNPNATTLTDGYTVPASTSAVLSSVIVANRAAAPTAFRIAHAVAGAADNNKQYLFYDVAIAANATHTYVLGITMAATDVLRVYATLATLSFNVYGVENA